MTGRFHSIVSGLFLLALLTLPIPAAFALDADPVLLEAPDKKPFVMTVMGVRKAFPVAADVIRVEIGMASNSGPLRELDAYRIVSEDDPEFAYEKFVQPSDVTCPENHSVTELSVPKGFKAESKPADIREFKRETVDLKLHAPMQAGRTYAVVTRGHGSDVVSAGRAACRFKFVPADIAKAPDVEHKPELRTLTALGLRGLDSVGNGIIRLEFGPAFFCQEGYRLKHYRVTVNGKPVEVKAMGRRSQIDLYRPTGWPYSVLMQHEVFLQMDRVLEEGDRLRVEVDPVVVSGANTAEMVFSDKLSFSSAIKVNQVGYITSAVKTAEIGRWLGSFPDEAAILTTSAEAEHFRDISAEEIFFGASKGEKDDKDKKTSDAQDKKEAVGSGTASAAPHEFAKSSLKYDVPPPFEIRDARTDEVVFSGQSRLSNPGNRPEGRAQYSGENVYEIDFTSFKTPGRYYIAVPGTGRSFEFAIASDVYDEAFQTAAYGVFAQRCGIALEPPYSEWRRVACHDRGIQLTTQRKIDGGEFIDAKKAVFEKNPSPDASVRPAVYAGPGLVAHFPFDGSAANAVPGGMTLSPVKGAAQSFKTLPNLIWDGESNRVFETKSGRDNGWTGKLDCDKSNGLTFHFWLRRTDAPKGNHFDGDILALRAGSSDSFRFYCVWGIPYYVFNRTRFYSGGRFGDDAWHSCSVTIGPDPASGRWICRLYRDGILLKTPSAPDTFSPGDELTLGAVTNVGAEGCYFDEFRIYDRVLSGEEIAKLSERVDAVVPKRLAASGGHHDAGDYNPRSHIEVAQILMDAYELAPKKFYDGQLNIPEKGNGIPDILDEALWALKLWIGLQDEDGGVYNGTESDGDPNFFQTVELDPKGDYVFAKDSLGSFLFAGAMAQASRLLEKLGKKEMAADYLARARRAYDWAVENKPRTNDAKTFGSFYTVPLAYAAAQLYHTTGEDAFHQAFFDNTPWKRNSKAKISDSNYDLSLAAYAYAAVPPSMADLSVHSDVVRAICEEADSYVSASNKAPYKFVRHPNAPINWGTGAYEHFLPVVWHAWAFTDNKLKVKSYREAMIRTADNTLGCNPLNLSWIVGLGSNGIHAPLHNSRFNPTGFSVPGMQAQGPDDRGREYNYADTLFPKRDKTPPLYCFVDTIFAIEMNEGTVIHQAETMAAFGLLLPDRKTAEDPKAE
ncbi:MAG: glycoside hydrolase family 9 protein [Lentisphaeria bacterium]|nr:glycoside hydrolase family 9 protein [Lentisphaeria bacterium]